MSSETRPSPPRAGSYVLVSSSAPLDESAAVSNDALLDTHSRPRLFFLLPLVAALDVAVVITLGVLVLRQEAQHHGADPPSRHPDHDPVIISSSFVSSQAQLDEAAWERRKIVLLVVAFSITRALAYGMVGLSKRIRQLGVTIAAISILSTLFYVSIANLLFQARRKPDTLKAPPPFWSSLVSPDKWRWPHAVRHFEPTMSILVGAEMAFTVIEWILYIAVVGVKIPPGGNPVQAKRWARGLADDPYYQRGADAQSLYPSDDTEEAEEGSAQAAEGDASASARALEGIEAPYDGQQDQTRALLASPISTLSKKEPADGSDQPLLGATSSTPRDYGSTLSEPRTPSGPSHAHHASVAYSQASIRSARSPAATAATPSMSRSTSARSRVYSRSPGAAELGAAGRHGQAVEDDDEDEDDERDEEGDEVAEGSDPDDIIDITPSRAVARKEARLRLARAALPERRASGGTLSTLNIFGGGASNDASTSRAADGEARGPNVFSDEAGSPIARNTRDDHRSASLLPVTNYTRSDRDAIPSADTSMQSSTSMTLPSSSSTRTVSTQSSSIKDRKLKLPKWMKRSGSKKK